MNDTQAQLEAHERECAIFRQMVDDKLNGLDKRMWRIEALIMISTASVIGLAVSLVAKL
jgi:hypothetical protein